MMMELYKLSDTWVERKGGCTNAWMEMRNRSGMREKGRGDERR
jgi:hypothetical protein